MNSRSVALGSAVLGGLLGLVASAQPWWRATAQGADVPFTGSDASAGLTQALAAVVLAGTLLSLALRALGRRIVAVPLTLAGIGMMIAGLLRLRPTEANVETRLREVSLSDSYTLAGTAWPWVFALAGLLVVLGAVVMFARAPRWRQRGDRFSRTTPAEAAAVDETDPASLWKALDAGIDPTSPPDATSGGEDDRMGSSRSKDSRQEGADGE